MTLCFLENSQARNQTGSQRPPRRRPGKGSVAVPRSPEPAIRPAETPHATPGGALLAAFTLAIMGIKGAEVAARLRNKVRANEPPKGKKENRNG
jgi:hypothetical protein